MARELVIVKIGGSIITGREKETINFQGLSRIADELRDACKSKQLIVVHGGGSFTHHLSADYRLYEGAKDERDRINAAIIQGNMMRLNLIFVKSLHERGVPAISVVPSTSTITREGRILKFDLEPMRLALSSGFVPVANGDISLDYSKVVSDSPTEGLVGYLAMQLAPEKVIIATDVDGTFTTNPKKDSCAKLISTVDERNIAQVIEAVKPSDGYGGEMFSKVASLYGISASASSECQIVNANVPGRLYGAITGEKVIGTMIKARPNGLKGLY